MRTRLKLSEKQVDAVQGYQTLARVVNQAFGGGSETDPKPPANVMRPQNLAELQLALATVLGT